MKVKRCSCGNCASVYFGQNESCDWAKSKWGVCCVSCRKDTGLYKTESEAIKAWNKIQECDKE